eukprot:CAMPEP_0179010800 /NCGR_PEP_ID=MMETSP0796-20121207/318_1 /TAXON_ID=73915 /ORGANISM="Pyrodinium bahamense, Strain pbaha01" /LENGTH=145 /DNA_ID=CAMNT_0020706125 /DNA_START=9 /DNA_END=444 /DNA_ORIENTATION=+
MPALDGHADMRANRLCDTNNELAYGAARKVPVVIETQEQLGEVGVHALPVHGGHHAQHGAHRAREFKLQTPQLLGRIVWHVAPLANVQNTVTIRNAAMRALCSSGALRKQCDAKAARKSSWAPSTSSNSLKASTACNIWACAASM